MKAHIPVDAQTVLISAVISNASEIGAWLAGSDVEVVEGSQLVAHPSRVQVLPLLQILGESLFRGS